MTIVPLHDAWVDANFKENQLAHLRPGQPVTLIADATAARSSFHGRVTGFSAGTGSAFALLPAQNASGNWIKVVQRVPVRIALDRRELQEHPLQIGLSMKVDVDTHERSATRLQQVERSSPVYETKAFGSTDARGDERIERIIADNAAAPASVRQALAAMAEPADHQPFGRQRLTDLTAGAAALSAMMRSDALVGLRVGGAEALSRRPGSSAPPAAAGWPSARACRRRPSSTGRSARGAPAARADRARCAPARAAPP